MATKFRGSNDLASTRDLFNERGRYNNGAVAKKTLEDHKGLFRDFWFIENMYYGKIDRQHRFLVAKPSKIKAVNTGSEKTIFLVDFVADALSDFIQEHKKALSFGKITNGDDILSDLKSTKGHTNLFYDYEQYMEEIRKEVHKIIASNHRGIENFNDFVDFFLSHAISTGGNKPLTLTGYVASRFSGLSGTGLFAEFSPLRYDKDSDKSLKLLNQQNYKFFIKNCLNHGFLIDYNVPWRVCANLGSNEMEKYMLVNGTNSQTVFEDYYDFTYLQDVEILMNYLSKFYNRFVSVRPNIRREKYSTKEVYGYVDKRERITEDKLNKEYDETYRINLYVDIRNYETKNRYNLSLIENIKENAISYLASNGLDEAYRYINQQFIGFLNDPYGYNGYVIRGESEINNPNLNGQDVQNLLDASVANSRKTIY